MATFWTELEPAGSGTDLVLQPTGDVVCSFTTFWEANAARITVRTVAAMSASDALEEMRRRLEAAGFASVH